MLLAPAFGRLLPLPLLQPWAWEATFAVTLLFPLWGMWSDVRRRGRAHPAWGWGLAVIAGAFVAIEAIAYSPAGAAIYESVTEGTRGATIPPLEFQPPPEGPLMTGRS